MVVYTVVHTPELQLDRHKLSLTITLLRVMFYDDTQLLYFSCALETLLVFNDVNSHSQYKCIQSLFKLILIYFLQGQHPVKYMGGRKEEQMCACACARVQACSLPMCE